eukprot:scaffold19978_cov37-Attheya_sp.AAC.2
MIRFAKISKSENRIVDTLRAVIYRERAEWRQLFADNVTRNVCPPPPASCPQEDKITYKIAGGRRKGSLA